MSDDEKFEKQISDFDKMFEPPPETPLEPYYVHVEPKVRSMFSVYFVNTRNVFPDNYPAKFDEELARYLIETWTKPGDIVMDPMAGSGTIPLVAFGMGRSTIYQDINNDAMQLFLSKIPKSIGWYDRGDTVYWASCDDSTKQIRPSGRMVDLILTSPPFGLSIDATHDKYSDDKADLANSGTYDTWRAGMKLVLKNCYKALKPGKLCIVETRPRSKAGHTYPLNVWVCQDGVDVGFNFFSEIIEIVDYYKMVSYGSADLRKPIPKHAYLTILQKPINERLQ